MTQPDIHKRQQELSKTGSGQRTLLVIVLKRSVRPSFWMYQTQTRWEKLILNKLPDYYLQDGWHISFSNISLFPTIFSLTAIIQRSLTLPELASHSKVSHPFKLSSCCIQKSTYAFLTLFYFNSLSIFSFTSFFFYYFLSLFVHPTKTRCRKRLCLIVLCVSLYSWVHFSRAVLLYLQVASHLIQETVTVPDLASHSKASHSQLVCEQDKVPIENIRL